MSNGDGKCNPHTTRGRSHPHGGDAASAAVRIRAMSVNA